MGYKISAKVSEDIENTWLYIFENWSLEQADRYINLIPDKIEYLAENPYSGKDPIHIRKNYRSRRRSSEHIAIPSFLQPI